MILHNRHYSSSNTSNMIYFPGSGLSSPWHAATCQEVLAMQDAMHPASETFQSTSRVAAWLVEKQLPWLEGEDGNPMAKCEHEVKFGRN